MSKEPKDNLLIPLLITAVAAYFGLKGRSEKLAEIAKDLTNRAINDQARNNHRDRATRRHVNRKGARSLQDSYYA